MGDARSVGTEPGGRPGNLPLTKMQESLLGRLPTYSSNAAEAYLGALHVYHGNCYTDQPSHLAYALRDVVDHLAREKQSVDEKKSRLREGDREANLRRTFDPVTRRGYVYDGHYRTLVEEYDKLSGIAHQRDPVDDLIPFDAMPRIERALYDLSFPQVATNRMIDKMILEPPTLERAKALIRMISTGAAQSRVIGRLPVNWLESMDGAGFFKDPVGYREAHRYLFRCAGECPGRVAEIIKRYDPAAVRDNRFLFLDLLDCMMRMPVGHAASVSSFMIKAGLHDMFVHHPGKYLEAAASLCHGGEYALAMEFARKGLSLDNINHRYPSARWLDAPVREFADATMNEAPLQLFGLLADMLEDIITSGRTGHALPDAASSMRSKRPTVEESDQNVSDLPSSLVAHMRNCLTIMGRGGRAQIRRAVETTKRRRPLIYRRLEMFAYGAFPDTFKKEMEDYAVRYLGNDYTYHEHYAMLERHYCSMPARARDQISDAITRHAAGDGPAGATGRAADDSNLREIRHLRHLECIEKCLDDEQLVILKVLLKKHDRSSHPGHLFFRGSKMTAPDRGPGPLEGKDPGQVIDMVHTHRPRSVVLPAEILRGFSYLASASPGEFSKRAMDLAGVDPRFQEEFFRSMGGALEGGKSIDWGGTITLLESVCEAYEDGKYENEETALAACSMLESAFRHSPPGIEFRKGLRRPIMSFVKASSPDRDRHLESFEDDLNSGRPIDVINMSINSLEGMSFLVMMMYALWCHEKTKNTKKPKLVPEVKAVLDQYVEGPRTIFRDAILGSCLSDLYFFDRDWTRCMVEIICTSIPARIAFWDGYVSWNHLDGDVFSGLRHMYDGFLTGCMPEILSKQQVLKSTVDHCVSAYLYGYRGSAGTFNKFLKYIKKNPSDDVVDHCVSQVGMVVRSIQDSSSFDVKRLKTLWSNRVLSKRDLTYWFVESKVDRKASIMMYSKYIKGYSGPPYLLYPVLDELKLHADESSYQVVSALIRLVKMNMLDSSEIESIKRIEKILEKHRKEIGNDLKKLRELVKRSTFQP